VVRELKGWMEGGRGREGEREGGEREIRVMGREREREGGERVENKGRNGWMEGGREKWGGGGVEG
jgi:hypothetical protein